ncbi:14586_t:CDS:2 [Funneliformis geosporum]|uniref:13602_t:CDS:1 n=1 Tax=Funneliformis geosporum TaxID=1117311 RepID=A0A9W4WZX8_9GLOM|nr:14586_t:CDS:2 [Funneliformis geosporum]CAI2176121.1 13602_t:CDS:2 [Funneliformis geosporum]
MSSRKRKRVKFQKQINEANFYEEVEEKSSTRKAPRTRSRKEVNNIKNPVIVGRKTREKEVKDRQMVVKVNINNNEIPKTRGKGARLKKNNIQDEHEDYEENDIKDEDDEEYRLEDDENDDEEEEYIDDEQEHYSDSSSELIAHKKPYYGGRKKLPQRAATTQKIDYSVNHYYHDFQDYFFTRLDDDDYNDEPKRKKSLSMPTRKRSSDNDYSDISSQDEKNLKSTPKRTRRKKLPQRGSKEKNIDYSENKYYRQFDSAMNAKFWSDKLSNDENNASDTDKNRSNSNKKSQISFAIPSTPTSNKTS